MRATQVTPALILQDNREPNWVAHMEFTLRPRFARTGVVGHDSLARPVSPYINPGMNRFVRARYTPYSGKFSVSTCSS
jgi:hypothetical protein